MKFMTLVKSAESSGPPPQALMDGMAKLAEDAFKSGLMVEMGGLVSSAAGTRVRLSNGKLTVTDGPFAEAKEVIGGYAILQVKSKQEAIEATRRFMELHGKHWPGWEGETEVRQIFDSPDLPPGAAQP